MKDYKVIQKINNLLKREASNHTEVIHEYEESIILSYSLQYFSEECAILSYPAKSYCVAIIYAHLLGFYFQEDFFQVLDDPELLCLNDDFFKTYSSNKVLYDKILKAIGFSTDNFALNLQLSQVRRTAEYFAEEFSVEIDKYYRHWENPKI